MYYTMATGGNRHKKNRRTNENKDRGFERAANSHVDVAAQSPEREQRTDGVAQTITYRPRTGLSHVAKPLVPRTQREYHAHPLSPS